MRSVFRGIRSLPAPAWVLFGGTFVNRFGTFVMPFLALYVTRNGWSARDAGVAVSAYGAGHLIASLAGGHLADRIGRRHTIALSMFASVAVMLALSQARTLSSIIALAVAAGAAAELYRPAASALLGDLVAPEQRVIAFGMYRFAINLGFAAGPATAGFLADRSFLYLFLGDAATSLIYGLVALVALPHGVRSAATSEKVDAGLRLALRDRPFMIFLAATLCVTFVEFQLHSTVPLHIANLGFAPSTYGALMSLNGILIVLFELALISWTQKFPRQSMIALGYGLTGLGVAVTGLAAGIPALAITVVIWTLGEMIYAPVTGAFVTDIAPEHHRGRYMGLWHLMWSGGMLLGPFFGTMMYARSPQILWIVCLALGVIAATASMFVQRTPIAPAVAAPASRRP